MSRVNSTGVRGVAGCSGGNRRSAVVAALASAGVVGGVCAGSSDVASAITAQLVPAAEIQPSLP